jgi:hypothetical protein
MAEFKKKYKTKFAWLIMAPTLSALPAAQRARAHPQSQLPPQGRKMRQPLMVVSKLAFWLLSGRNAVTFTSIQRSPRNWLQRRTIWVGATESKKRELHRKLVMDGQLESARP